MLGLAKIYKCRPSSLLNVTDPYTAYCFDEACAYIQCEIDNGNKPEFNRNKKFSSFTDLYASYGK